MHDNIYSEKITLTLPVKMKQYLRKKATEYNSSISEIVRATVYDFWEDDQYPDYYPKFKQKLMNAKRRDLEIGLLAGTEEDGFEEILR